MTDALIIQQERKIHKLFIRAHRFRTALRICLCSQSKKRIAWDLFKTRRELALENKIYTEMCDAKIQSEEIQNFLYAQL